MSGRKKGVLLCSVSFSLYCLISFALVLLLFLFTLDTIANFRYKNLVIYTHANIITLISLCHEGSPIEVPDSMPLALWLFADPLPPTVAHIKSCGVLYFSLALQLDLWCDGSLVFRNLLDKTLGAVSVSVSVSHYAVRIPQNALRSNSSVSRWWKWAAVGNFCPCNGATTTAPPKGTRNCHKKEQQQQHQQEQQQGGRRLSGACHGRPFGRWQSSHGTLRLRVGMRVLRALWMAHTNIVFMFFYFSPLFPKMPCKTVETFCVAKKREINWNVFSWCIYSKLRGE